MVQHAVLALAILPAALVAAQGAQAQGSVRGLVPMPPVVRPAACTTAAAPKSAGPFP